VYCVALCIRIEWCGVACVYLCIECGCALCIEWLVYCARRPWLSVHVSIGAQDFDVVEEVPRIRAAIFADVWEGRVNPIKDGPLRAMLFAMIMLQLVLIGRGSLVSRFCPLFEDMEVEP
jgi:hypothetical protein